MSPVIETIRLTKVLGNLEILKGISFSVPEKSWVSLTGPSGSGKTTLLGILAGLESPTQGSVLIDGQDLSRMSEDERAEFRASNMGFVFQSFRLIPHLSALENVCIPLELLKRPNADREAAAMLERVGLADRMSHRPSELSGGEQQRVAVARAFVAKPRLLFADEPTGNLDSKNGDKILSLIQELHIENGATLVIVTHDPNIAARGNQRIQLRDGEIAAG